ncbi:hypothetical protein ACFQMA_06455 [Halosimplex aquaticum]|uniref:MJ0042 family finger-like domain-containing protein n=1 Tax=Halosimplex aquaticum TaxID=3026162 RepID=A0ABD5Y2D9_9EURY|nr:hypothetical protein [Halosimplex aquaticum]
MPLEPLREPTPMIPPLVRRCPECGKIGLAKSFAAVDGDGDRRVECPRCGHRFGTVADPVLN